MDEKQKEYVEEAKKDMKELDAVESESTNSDNIIVDKPEDIVKNANAAAKRLEDANKETAKLVARQEALQVEKTLGGTTKAGQKRMTKDQKEIQNARDMLAGTGYEDDLFPKNAKIS